mmetsp:Transcript_74/g.99  ORF Transcript_74/g.99 Transcript_74/m.99 type:complete len:245 (-) Transcript_74:168-902(-)
MNAIKFQLVILLINKSCVAGFASPMQLSREAHYQLLATSSPDQEDNSYVDPFKYYSSNSQASDSNQNEIEQNARVLKKKKKKAGYKVSDERDNLPFVVRMTTPDPYTKVEKKRLKAQKNTKDDRKKNLRPKMKAPKYSNLKVGGIAASIFVNDDEDDGKRELLPVLGEFKLDKSTSCGDIVVVGEKTFVVQKARCQYKYAGGRKFEMVRKILEVKPILRIANEEVLQRSLEKTTSNMTEPPQLE